MVQDLFLLSIDERGQGFERTAVRAILAKDALAASQCGRWTYPDGSVGDVHGLDDTARPRATHLFFTSVDGGTMLERIFEIAVALEVVLFWPGQRAGAPNACVARAERLAKIGAALRTALKVVVVRDAAHLAELIAGTPSA